MRWAAHRTGLLVGNNFQHPGWAHTTVGPRPGPRAPGRPPPPAARLPGLPGCPLRELGLGNTTPAPRPLPSNTHFKFVLGQFDIAEAAGCIGTGPNRPQRLYNGRCEQLVAPDGLESAAGSPYSR